jgi:hypothetical protein
MKLMNLKLFKMKEVITIDVHLSIVLALDAIHYSQGN